MGGSGGSGWSHSNPADIAKQIREAENSLSKEAFQTELSSYLSELLVKFNDREVDLIKHRIEEILKAIEGVIDSSVEQIFGGSVAKHTYVNGLSDIDCLLVIKDSSIEKHNPSDVLDVLAKTISQELDGKAQVTSGNLAVTVKYGDDCEIQFLPAIKSPDGLKIPSLSQENAWSKINPEKFQAGLTKYNEKCDGKLVPTIKLVKAIIGELPESQQLTGYHIESLAIDAFKNYNGKTTTSAMLPHFFDHSKDRVLSTITDTSGQSVHVDEYMGSNNSTERQNASHLLDRIGKRIRNANAGGALDQWKTLFGDNQ